MIDDTRDLAIAATADIRSHIVACERRYQESTERLDRVFTYIKEAHEKTGAQIESIQTTLAEQRGAGKMVKVMSGGAAALAGAISGLVSGHFIK